MFSFFAMLKIEKILGSLNFYFQKFVDNTQQCFAFTPQANFPAHNLNFQWRWRWWDQMQAIVLNLFLLYYILFISPLLQKSQIIMNFLAWISLASRTYLCTSCLNLLIFIAFYLQVNDQSKFNLVGNIFHF